MSTKFKEGYQVEVIVKSSGVLPVGHIGYITSVESGGIVQVDNELMGWFGGLCGGELRLIKGATTPHKHSDLIKAWADGAEVQYKSSVGGWYDMSQPSWSERGEYRLKPTPEPTHTMELSKVEKELINWVRDQGTLTGYMISWGDLSAKHGIITPHIEEDV